MASVEQGGESGGYTFQADANIEVGLKLPRSDQGFDPILEKPAPVRIAKDVGDAKTVGR